MAQVTVELSGEYERQLNKYAKQYKAQAKKYGLDPRQYVLQTLLECAQDYDIVSTRLEDV